MTKTNSLVRQKSNFFVRICNRVIFLFKKIPIVKFTEKEVRTKFFHILGIIEGEFSFKKTDKKRFEENINKVNIYFLEKGQKEIENSFNFYEGTHKKVINKVEERLSTYCGRSNYI